MDVIINFDEAKYLREKNEYESYIPALQECVNMFNEMGIKPVQPDELQRLFTDTSALAFDKMTEGKTISIGKFSINKEKAIDILNMPLSFKKTLQHIQQMPAFIKIKVDSFNASKIDIVRLNNYYELSAEGVISLTGKMDEQLKKRSTAVATCEKTKKLFALAKFVIAKYNELDLNAEFKHDGTSIANHLDSILCKRVGENEITIVTDNLVKYNYN